MTFVVVVDNGTHLGHTFKPITVESFDDVMGLFSNYFEMEEDTGYMPYQPRVYTLDTVEGNLRELDLKIVRDSHYSDQTVSYYVTSVLPQGQSVRGGYRIACADCHYEGSNPDIQQHGR